MNNIHEHFKLPPSYNPTDLIKKYKNYDKMWPWNECAFNKWIFNPNRCPAAKEYKQKLNKYVETELTESIRNTNKKEVKLKSERIKKQEHKNIYPIVNHDFDYSTGLKKKYNVFAQKITNEPTINNLIKTPVKMLEYTQPLVKEKYPEKNTIAGIDDIYKEDTKKLQIKNFYKAQELPYPSFRKDYPECKFKTTGEYASSYFIKAGTCSTKITDKKKCLEKEYSWVPNKKGFDKSMTGTLSTKKKKPVQKIPAGSCFKPRFVYVNNRAKGAYGQNGLIPSTFTDLMNVSPEKLFAVLAGQQIDGTGLLPCIEEFNNYNKSKTNNNYFNVIIILVIIAMIFFINFK
jgi:hypothetical protein